MTTDPQQRITRFVAGGWGIIFTILADGTVQWWYHTDAFNGAATWANGGSPRTVGSGFSEYVEILGSDNGVMWCVDAQGRVWRYRYVTNDLNTGAGSWENGGSGVQIGSGYDRFTRWFGGPSGILWCVDAAGDLWRSDYITGSLSTPTKVGSGWDDARWLGADLDGVIYAVRRTELHWFKHSLAGGWANGGNPIKVGGSEWDDRSHTGILADAGGMIYAVAPTRDLTATATGDLLWTRLNNYGTVATDGSAQWASSTAKVVGNGFTYEPWASLQGYAQPVSAAAGGTVGICVSTTLPSVNVSVWRHDLPTPTQVQAPVSVAGQLQTLPVGFAAKGCGWVPGVSVTVDPSWPSGVYAACISGPNGLCRPAPFVVRPAAPTAALAVILPTLTYQAYNAWGGHSAYSNCPATTQVQITLRRPSRTMLVGPSGRLDAELYSDLLLLRWLQGQGVAYDVYTDEDLHNDLGLLKPYRAVMLGTHPEYVTGAMRQALALYLRAGGHLIYPGGNGLYESLELSADSSTAIWRTPTGARYPYRDRGLPEHQLLGVGYDSRGWMTFAPYKVLKDHPILSGTGLSVGETFGATGAFRAASGVEFDMVGAFDGSGTSADVIAMGQNGTGYGAQMVLLDRPGGGRVFSAGSLTFVGALDRDQAMSLLFLNVVNQMLQGSTPVAADLIQPPYRANGYVHCWIPDGRALARCGYPDSQNTCDIVSDSQWLLYPREYRCPICDDMFATGEPGPATWPA